MGYLITTTFARFHAPRVHEVERGMAGLARFWIQFVELFTQWVEIIAIVIFCSENKKSYILAQRG